MAEFDFAIAGTDLFSGLLAGLLARDHGKKIVRIGRLPSTQRLWRAIPLALPLATRPAAWRMVRGGEAEIRDLAGQIGQPDAMTSSEVALFGDYGNTTVALDHLVHIAAGYGHQVRRFDGGWALRRVTLLDRDAIDARLSGWLEAAGVRTVDEASADAALTILADDEAILDSLDEDRRPALLISEAMTSTLIVSSRPPAIPIQRFVDRGVTLVARPGNTILALVSGERDVEARLASTLRGPFPVKRLATTRYRRLITRDGAPLIGRLKGTRHFVVAGLGDSAAFLAPAMARFLAGTSERDEKSWFAAHDPSRPRASVVDFAPGAEAAQ
jgi:hypothetical protein